MVRSFNSEASLMEKENIHGLIKARIKGHSKRA